MIANITTKVYIRVCARTNDTSCKDCGVLVAEHVTSTVTTVAAAVVSVPVV